MLVLDYQLKNKENQSLGRLKIEAELRQPDKKKIVFAASGSLNSPKFGSPSGQMLDFCMYEPFKGILKDDDFKFWYNMWKKYHLNDMHAGTVEQEKAIHKAKKEGILPPNADYSVVCEYLASINMLEVPYRRKTYRYGSAWLYRAIPKTDLHRIQAKLNNGLVSKKLTI